MNRLHRRRAVSGLLGLLALFLSFAEAGAASMCDPAMSMQHDVEVAGVDAGDMAAEKGRHPAAGGHDSHPDGREAVEGGTDSSPCPWMPMMGSGCGALVIAPAVSTELGAAGPSSAQAFRATRQLATLHSTDPLRRPPRA